MRTFASNEEYFDALSGLINRWCDDRKLAFLATLLPGYLALNGLTDGWIDLHDALFRLRAFGPDAFPEEEWLLIHDLTQTARKVIDRE